MFPIRRYLKALQNIDLLIFNPTILIIFTDVKKSCTNDVCVIMDKITETGLIIEWWNRFGSTVGGSNKSQTCGRKRFVTRLLLL